MPPLTEPCVVSLDAVAAVIAFVAVPENDPESEPENEVAVNDPVIIEFPSEMKPFFMRNSCAII